MVRNISLFTCILVLSLAAHTAHAGVTYRDVFPPNYSVTGIRQDSGPSNPVVITGSYQAGGEPQALLYKGPLYPTDNSGFYFLNPTFPGQVVTTSIFYGPNTSLFDPSLGAGNIRAVGSYKYIGGGIFDHGMIYQGGVDGSGAWTQIDVPNSLAGGTVANTIAHSTMGNLVVGNYDIAGQPGREMRLSTTLLQLPSHCLI